jgi:protein-S-isoprenylcysteine O-methyltransferase Ste14
MHEGCASAAGDRDFPFPNSLLPQEYMNTDMIFRILILASVVFIGVIRIYYQSKISRDAAKFDFRERAASLIFATAAAAITFVFGAAYLFFPGTFGFAYAVPFPAAVRWAGVALLALGIVVLGTAHYHLSLSFSSFVGSKEGHKLAQSGPYRLVRHPIYLAYLLLCLGGGLAAGNWVLAVVPVTCFFITISLRMPQEERILTDLFGDRHIGYMQRTGNLLPRVRAGT